MPKKLDLGKVQEMLQGVIERSAETPQEVQARIEIEKSKERSRLVWSYAELALLAVLFFACIWRGFIDTTDVKLAEWSRAGLFAILTYIVGKKVGKNDSDG